MNICFLCASLFPKLRKVDNYSETSLSKCYRVLFKYLLNVDANNDRSSEQRLLSSYILKQLEDVEDGDDGSSIESGEIQFCSRCSQLSKDVWNLRRDLEATQIRIHDKLKLIHHIIIMGGKFLKKTELSSSMSTFTNHSNEMLYRFQNIFSNVEWLTNLEPDLWTNEIFSVADIVKEEPSDSFNDEIRIEDVCDHISDIDLPDTLEGPIPKSKRGRPKKSKPDILTASSVHQFDNPELNDDVSPSDSLSIEAPTPTTQIERGRGRPTKNTLNSACPPSPKTVKSPICSRKRKGKGGRSFSRRKKHKVVFKRDTYFKISRTQPCELCNFKCHTYNAMEAHLRINHETSTKSFNCSKCSLGFTTETLFKLHTNYHSHTSRCEICTEAVIILDMKKHLEEAHQKQVFSCPGCSFVFLDFISLIRHTARNRHVGLSLPCVLCPEGSPQDPAISQNRQSLYKHLYIVHNMTDILFKCEEPNCMRTFFGKKEKEEHIMLRHCHSLKLKCPQCDNDKTYATHRSLDNHIRNVHKKEAMFHCSRCSKSFVYKAQLERHEMDAHGDPKFKCDVCAKELMAASSLVKHLRNLHGIGADKHIEKQFSCQVCSKTFPTRGLFNRHMSIHSETKDFACEICGFMTKRQQLLKRHMMVHTGVKKHACPYCPKKFLLPDNVKQHIRVHTGERPYQCEECGSAFNQKSSLNIHKRKHVADSSFVPRGPLNRKSKEEAQTPPVTNV